MRQNNKALHCNKALHFWLQVIMQNIQGWYLFFLNWELCGFHIYSCPVAYLLIPATQNAVDVFFRKHHDGTQFSTGSFIETVNT